jgi:NADH-ubiquinone oxidoreductase chain 3
MTSTSFFFLFIPLLAIILLAINLTLAPHNPYQEKDSTFECGFHSFLGQNRSEFSVSFFIFGLLFLLFDIEILLVYPFFVSAYNNGIYGLIIALILLTLLTVGFVFEIGKNALKIDSRQYNTSKNNLLAVSSFDVIINLLPFIYFEQIINYCNYIVYSGTDIIMNNLAIIPNYLSIIVDSSSAIISNYLGMMIDYCNPMINACKPGFVENSWILIHIIRPIEDIINGCKPGFVENHLILIHVIPQIPPIVCILIPPLVIISLIFATGKGKGKEKEVDIPEHTVVPGRRSTGTLTGSSYTESMGTLAGSSRTGSSRTGSTGTLAGSSQTGSMGPPPKETWNDDPDWNPNSDKWSYYYTNGKKIPYNIPWVGKHLSGPGLTVKDTDYALFPTREEAEKYESDQKRIIRQHQNLEDYKRYRDSKEKYYYKQDADKRYKAEYEAYYKSYYEWSDLMRIDWQDEPRFQEWDRQKKLKDQQLQDELRKQELAAWEERRKYLKDLYKGKERLHKDVQKEDFFPPGKGPYK